MTKFDQQHLPKFRIYYLEKEGDDKTILERGLIYVEAQDYIKKNQRHHKEFLLIERD